MVATLERCSCPDCSCSVEPPNGVKKGDKWYCSVACAEGHPEGVGCGHSSCHCTGET